MKIFTFLLLSLVSIPTLAAQSGRFFLEGDGEIALTHKKTLKTTKVIYRNADGSYNREGLDKINQLFGEDPKDVGEDISLRLISNLDYFQDKYTPGKPLLLVSGYRSPTYNESLRKQGKLAAKTSYHIQGMAADIIFEGIPSKKMWEKIREENCCGAGFYDGKSVHIDSGKPRFWTSATAIPKTNEPQENKSLYFSIDQDIYLPGEKMRLFLSGISDFGFGIKSEFKLKSADKGKTILTFIPDFYGRGPVEKNECVPIKEKSDARHMEWKIPEGLPKGLLSIEVEFCDHSFKKMPKKLMSRAFKVRQK